jgi:hypothetical protein
MVDDLHSAIEADVMEDAIVEETLKARRQLDAEFGADLNRLYAYLCEIEHQNAERVVKLAPKRAISPQRHGRLLTG